MQEGSIWAVNPLSIAHGWVAWTNHEGNTKNTMVGEVMEPVHAPKPPRPAPTDGWPYTEQRMFELRCMDGDDEGTEVVYKVASIGGMRAVDDLLGALQGQLNDNPLFPCPVVELLSRQLPAPEVRQDLRADLHHRRLGLDGRQAADRRAPGTGCPGSRPRRRPPRPRLPPPRRLAVARPPPRPCRGPAPAEPEPTARRRPIRR